MKEYDKLSLTCTILLLALATAGIRAETALTPLEQLCAGHKVEACIARAPSGKIMLLIDDEPQPLFWANLTSGQDPNYRRAGFNTVFAELGYPGPGDDAPLEQQFRAWDNVLLNIKERGLYVIIYIHNSIHAHAGEVPWAFDRSWRDYVQAIVRRYRGVTNLIGWCFSDELADALPYSDEAFRVFLKNEYDSIKALNAAWSSDFSDFDQIKLEYQRDGHGRPEKSMVTPAFPFGIGPKAFDSARFKVNHIAYANEQFEAVIREVDPITPIWSGANNIGWAATQIPTTWGAFFDFYPGFSGDDYDTHHVWMVDIGRGPNLRPAMQMLLSENSSSYNWHLDARVIRGWMVESALHGAAGVTFWPWSFLGVDNRTGDRSSSTERIDMCGMTIRMLEASGIFEMLPRPTIAVMYQPYAEGWGALSQVYGVLRYPSKEPIALFRELKYGTKYGQIDYLTNHHLDRADLAGYGVILAPFTADLSTEQMDRLAEYVHGGGVLLADIGFGCVQAGKVVTGMTDQAKRLFGIRGLKVSYAAPGRWVATGAYSELLGGLRKDVDATQKLHEMVLDATPSTSKAALKGPGGQGLYVNRFGKGYAIFCSALAWSSPNSTDPLMRKIHEALFARRAGISMASLNAGQPSRPGEFEPAWEKAVQEPYFASGCEIVRYSKGYALHNRLDAHATIQVRSNDKLEEHTLAPRSVILVKRDQIIPLGSGVWPVVLGPKQ